MGKATKADKGKAREKESSSKLKGSASEKKGIKGDKKNPLTPDDDVGSIGEKPSVKRTSADKEKTDKRKSKLKNEDPRNSFEKLGSPKPVEIEPDWESEDVKSHQLLTDGFTYCMVLAMEDSATLTSMGHYLHHAVKTGVRKRFVSISGDEIAGKVKKYLADTKQPDLGKGNQAFWDRVDIWTEAVKHKLMQVKEVITTELNVGSTRKEIELTGARSKDILAHTHALPFTGLDLEQDKTPPAPPPSSEPKSRRSLGVGSTSKSLQHADDKSKKKAKLVEEANKPEVNQLNPTDAPPPPQNPKASKSRSSHMRKRGEPPLITMEEKDDAPAKGPQSFIILQGFYNPRIIEELLKIGVYVDGILLMTDEKVGKKNFSIIDIEDSIPGTFRPQNILPNYLKFVEKQNTIPLRERDIVGQFWAELAEMYNKAPTDSQFLDCALMNLVLPLMEHGLETPEGRAFFASKLFDEASQRIYEMLVLSDWFHDYTAASTVKEIKPMEEDMGHSMYERLLNQVPAECVTVPIIIECMLEQVVANVDRPENPPETDEANNNQFSEFYKFGRPDWGNQILQGGLVTLPKRKSDTKTSAEFVGLVYTPPLYIKNGDYASIRTCHLDEIVASHIASTQVAGDLRNVQSLLWQNAPEFNKGLYIKLLGNLNHFMYFLPPESIHFEDMFFILHLLLSAGVEVQLHKEAAAAKARDEKKRNSATTKQFTDMVHTTTTEPFSTHTTTLDNTLLEGTNLSKDHNYLAVNEQAGVHFIMAPDSNNQITISNVGHSKPKDGEVIDQTTNNADAANAASSPKPQSPSEKRAKKKSIPDKETTQAAGIETIKVIQNAAEFVDEEERILVGVYEADEMLGEEDDEGFNEEDNECEGEPEETEYYFGSEEGEESLDPETKKSSNRFIACEQEWFKDMNDFSVFKSLLECPALLAISESGALDLSKWIETYLLSSGLTQQGGDGMLIGQLKDWNFVEELVPVQMVQLLNEAVGDYLSMQRMYCPFYDTLLFIFNNPTPETLQAETQYYFKLKTLPGLQHFLEYTINDDEILPWLMGKEKIQGVETIDSISLTTLMRIIPEEQWLLVPSIKYMIYREQTKQNAKAKKVAIQPKPDQETTVKGENVVESVSQDKNTDPTKRKAEKESKSKTKRDSNASGASATKDKNQGKKRSLPDDPKQLKKVSKSEVDKPEKIEPALAPPFPDVAASGDNILGAIPSFHMDKAISKSKTKKPKAPRTSVTTKPDEPAPATKPDKSSSKKFDCYDLGKRVIVVASDTYHLFPMDGRIIQYDISTIEPEFRMMQLTVTKNGHQTFFYPYYIPHELNLTNESYVVCPYFHMVHANGTVFAFQDRRVTESAPYIKISMRQNTFSENSSIFSYDKVLFGSDVKARLRESRQAAAAASAAALSAEKPPSPNKEDNPDQIPVDPSQIITTPGEESLEEVEEMEESESKDIQSAKKKKEKEKEKGKKEKTVKKKGKDVKDKNSSEVTVKEEPAKKKKPEKTEKPEKLEKPDKPDKARKSKKKTDKVVSDTEFLYGEEEEEYGGGGSSSHEESNKTQSDSPPEWVYSDGDLTEPEDAASQKRKRSFYAPSWEFAEKLVQPLTHGLKITLPSSLLIELNDATGPPLTREIKQSYTARGSAKKLTESSRYYTMNGSVIKFMLNGTIQIMTARGVTTIIRELATSSAKEGQHMDEIFKVAQNVRIFNGDIILPNGDFWNITNGRKQQHDPIFVFTSGPLPNGEIFRRRQDGVIYLHRHDGTTITHYPDGTRFTTRMVVQRDPPEDMNDWVIVGLKYMIEHPNYSSIVFNTLSGNVHIRLPLGDWVRIFADGSMKLATTDKYAMDINKFQAILSFPPCSGGDQDIPNLTSVKLWHSKELAGYFASTSSEAEVSQSVFDAETIEIEEPQLAIPTEPCLELNNASGKNKSGSGTGDPVTNKKRLSNSKNAPDGERKASNPENEPRPSLVERARKIERHLSIHASKVFDFKVEPDPTLFEDVVLPLIIDQNENNEPVTNPATKPDQNKGPSADSVNKSPVIKSDQSQIKIKPARPNEGGQKTRGGIKARPYATKSLRNANKVPSKDGITKTSIISENLDGEALEEAVEEEEEEMEEIVQGTAPEEPTKETKKFEIREFLQFTDHTLLCKAIDSWDNRFAVDIYGETIVDKIDLVKPEVSKDELIKTLSEHCQLPQEYVSGILRVTSSESLSTAARRIAAMKQAHIDKCGNLPSTKIFVVKRDMSGYEYFKKSQVEKLMGRAKSCRDSMVIVDPLPSRDPRKYITIMEPVSEIEKPRGTWTSSYREPAFRPAMVTNKHLRRAGSSDLRWFGYVLMRAHTLRPKFVPNPREQYLKSKTSTDKGKPVKKAPKSKQPKASNQKSKTVALEEEEKDTEMDMLSVAESKMDKKGKSKDKLKAKADKKEKGKKKDKDAKANKDDDAVVPDAKPKSVKSQIKENVKKVEPGNDSRKTRSLPPQPQPAPEVEEEGEEADMPRPKGMSFRLDQSDIGQYPDDVPDLGGIYGEDEPIQIQPQYHADILSLKKAIVVRSFVEIPQVDEKLQRALLAASLSYGKTVQAQLEVFEENKFQDLRTEEEKENQQRIKQQLIEQNLSDMHLLEQRAGRVLNFHF